MVFDSTLTIKYFPIYLLKDAEFSFYNCAAIMNSQGHDTRSFCPEKLTILLLGLLTKSLYIQGEQFSPSNRNMEKAILSDMGTPALNFT